MRYGLIAIAAVLALAAFAVFTSFVGTGANIATAPSRAANRVVSTDNILNSYEAFYNYRSRYQTRLGDIRNNVELNEQETDPGQQRINRTNIVAMRSACRDLANKYNADAENLTSSWFRDGRLPQTLSVEACDQ